MCYFHHTLKDKAKVLLMSLPLGSLMIWEDVYNKFMEKFYSYQKTSQLKALITTFSHTEREPFHETQDRLKLLFTQYLHHSYPLQWQNQFCNDVLTTQCQFIIENIVEGVMGDKIASKTYNLFKMLDANSLQKISQVRRSRVHKIDPDTKVQL